jgi:hypothetical protein
VSGAVIHVQGQAAGPVYLADDSFDVGDSFDPLPPSGGTNAIASLVYARPDGEVVTATYLAQETATGCVFAGNAVG